MKGHDLHLSPCISETNMNWNWTSRDIGKSLVRHLRRRLVHSFHLFGDAFNEGLYEQHARLRGKIEIKKIENNTNRQVTYSEKKWDIQESS